MRYSQQQVPFGKRKLKTAHNLKSNSYVFQDKYLTFLEKVLVKLKKIDQNKIFMKLKIKIL